MRLEHCTQRKLEFNQDGGGELTLSCSFDGGCAASGVSMVIAPISQIEEHTSKHCFYRVQVLELTCVLCDVNVEKMWNIDAE